MENCRELLVAAEKHLEVILMLNRNAENTQLRDAV